MIMQKIYLDGSLPIKSLPRSRQHKEEKVGVEGYFPDLETKLLPGYSFNNFELKISDIIQGSFSNCRHSRLVTVGHEHGIHCIQNK